MTVVAFGAAKAKLMPDSTGEGPRGSTAPGWTVMESGKAVGEEVAAVGGRVAAADVTLGEDAETGGESNIR